MTSTTPLCPVCGTPISETKYAEIQNKIREEEQAKLEALQKELHAEYERRIKVEVDAAVGQALHESHVKLEASAAEQAMLTERVRQLEAREGILMAEHSRVINQQREEFARTLEESRKVAAEDAQRAAAKQVADLRMQTAEQQGQIADLKSELVSVREAVSQEVAERHSTDMAEQQRVHQEELAKQREILENHHQQDIQQLKIKNFEGTTALQQKVFELNRQLEKKTAHELGDSMEVDLYKALRDEFRGDDIRRVDKGEPGVDIVHTVFHKGEPCGTIVIDSKNRRLWQNRFVEKLRADKMAAKAEHAVLCTVRFPQEHKDIFLADDVVVVKPTQAVSIVRLLREHLICSYVSGLSQRDRSEKTDRLYTFITSDRFRQILNTTEQAVTRLEKIDLEDDQTHKKFLTRRGIARRQLEKAVQEMSTEITAIVEAPNMSGAKTMHATS